MRLCIFTCRCENDCNFVVTVTNANSNSQIWLEHIRNLYITPLLLLASFVSDNCIKRAHTWLLHNTRSFPRMCATLRSMITISRCDIGELAFTAFNLNEYFRVCHNCKKKEKNTIFGTFYRITGKYQCICIWYSVYSANFRRDIR